VRITKFDIYRNAAELTGELVECLCEYCDEKPESDHLRIETLGEIRGIALLATRLLKIAERVSADDGESDGRNQRE